MVNYGYECKGWSKEQKQELADDLGKELDLAQEHHFLNPHLEVDDLYNGVRIRKITHLSDDQVKELVKKADKIYEKHEAKRKRIKEMDKIAKQVFKSLW